MYAPGTIIGGKYRLEEQIGEGGMASVWRAEHTTLQRPVAIKFVQLVGKEVEARRERFLREARLAASIRHRCVVDIVDFGQSELGQPYMVMELLEGETLRERIDREPPLRTEETVRIFDMLMGGLAAIHDEGIVHRDLKPDNIYLTYDGEGVMPKLTDFGISRVSSHESQRPPGVRPGRSITKRGLVLGTPEYLSPEQARGLENIDRRSDIFSTGVLLYEALSGSLPFSADATGELIAKVIADAPAPLTDFGIDAALSEVVEMAMAKDPNRRLQNAREVRMAMRAATRLTAADLNDSQLVSNPGPPAFVSVPVQPNARGAGGKPVTPPRKISPTGDTLSAAPGPRAFSPWLGALAVVVITLIALALALM